MIKLPIFVRQRAAVPKNGVEFHQKFIEAFRCSVATSYDDWRHRKLEQTDRQADRRTDGQTILGIGRHAPPKKCHFLLRNQKTKACGKLASMAQPNVRTVH